MKNTTHLSVVAGVVMGLLSSSLFASDDNSTWKISGDIRAGYVYYDYGTNPTSQGFYTTPKVSVQSPAWSGFSAKVTGAVATDLFLNNADQHYANFVFNAADPKSYAIVQEAYLKYSTEGHDFRIGREEIDTPMISNDDYYFLADTYEVAHYTNTQLENMMMTVGYVHKMAGVWDSGAYDATVAPLGGTDFYSLSQASFVNAADKARANNQGAVYAGYNFANEHHKAQVWDYLFFDLYNVLFSQYDYLNSVESFSYNAALQFISFNETGALQTNNDTNINHYILSGKFSGTFDFGLSLNAAAMKFSEGPGQGNTIAAFGGYPFFAFGNIVHWFHAGSFQNAANYMISAGYDLGKIGIDGLNISLKHVYTDLDSQYSLFNNKGQEFQRTYDIALGYKNDNGLYANLQYQFADIDQRDDIHGFRLIGGYKF